VGESAVFRQAYQAVVRVAPSDTSVLFLGPSGAGKDLFARALHQLSPRAGGPWVAINCAALPRELVESELFGVEKGAFTGASRRRMGKVELAHGGTLFLDEIADLDPGSQGKLLRVLEEKCFQRLGGNRTVHSDVRLTAASNRDLARAVADRTFREDLYYRLQVFPIHVPPLRERGDDVLLLARHFLALFGREMKRPLPRLTEAAQQLLRHHTWPGNVRELRNAIERALILTEGPEIDVDAFELSQAEEGPAEARPPASPGAPWPRLREASRLAAGEVEAQLIRQALRVTGGNRTRAAALLGVSAKTLWAKLREHGTRSEAADEEPAPVR
jgi:DNA-binding NtrC family response regulator